MEKVTEINIIGEGKQLKQLLEENYTYAHLSKRFNKDKKSILAYVGAMQITVNKFIEQIEDLFQKPFNQVVTPVEDQLKEYILTIKNNIRYYNEPLDNKTINDLYEYSLKYSQPYDQLMAKGNLALYNYNMGVYETARIMLGEVVKSSGEYGFKELEVYYSVQQAFVQLEYDIKESRNILFRTELILEKEDTIEQISQLTLFNYYHFYGVLLRRMGKHKDAREIFHKAIEYATDDSKLARAMTNIGSTYYDQKDCKSALEWYEKALVKASQYPEVYSIILNNMALAFLKKKEKYRAIVFLGKAMEYITEEFDNSLKVVIYDTYLEIHGKNDVKLLEDLFRILDDCVVITVYQHFLVGCIQRLFDQFKENGNIELIQRLLIKLVYYCDQEGDKRPLSELSMIAMKMMHYLTKEGVFSIEKACKGLTIDSFTD